MKKNKKGHGGFGWLNGFNGYVIVGGWTRKWFGGREGGKRRGKGREGREGKGRRGSLKGQIEGGGGRRGGGEKEGGDVVVVDAAVDAVVVGQGY